MSQSQDMAAINDAILRTTPTNAAAAGLQDGWIQWYGALPAFERDYDSDALSDAKLRRDAFNRAMSTGAVSAPGPIAAVSPGPKPTIRRGSVDPKGSTAGPVHEWQAIVGAIPVDGIFGSQTESLTKTWQKAHGLVNDGIVGQLTWAQALANSNAVAALAAPFGSRLRTSRKRRKSQRPRPWRRRPSKLRRPSVVAPSQYCEKGARAIRSRRGRP